MGKKRIDPAIRLLAGAQQTPEGCWIPALRPKVSGYVKVWNGDRPVAAHRFAYELWIGPIPDGMTVDHLCHDPVACSPGPCAHRACVNPDHLAVAPIRDNVLRGGGPSARNATAVECVHGHPLSGDNLVVTSKGWRVCRECGRRSSREYQRRKRAA